MGRIRFAPLMCAAVLLITGCGDRGPTAAEQADSETAAELEAQAAQYREDQEKLDEGSGSAGSEPEPTPDAVDTEPDAEPADPETAQGARDAAPSKASSSPGALLTAADRTSFAAFGEGLTGAEGVAVVAAGRGGQVYRAGGLTTGVAWSTSKVPVAMAAIDAGTAQQGDLTAAITASDNAAAEKLWSGLGGSAASKSTDQLRAAGDTRTTVQGQRLRAGYTAFGQTQWSLTDQARFVAGMACVESGGQVLSLMQQTVSSQRWGLGTIGSGAAIKGGWGPGITAGSGDGWLDRQMGVVTIDGKKLGVAIATTPGNHTTGTANLTKIAGWLESHVNAGGAPSQPRC